MGVDFGSEYIKIAAPKQGSTVIDIVLNEASKRKSCNYVGFREEYASPDMLKLISDFRHNISLNGTNYKTIEEAEADFFFTRSPLAIRRFVGDDARSLAPRFPARMIPMPNALLGRDYTEYTNEGKHSEGLRILRGSDFFTVARDSTRGTLEVKLANKLKENTMFSSFTSEELTAMVLGYCKQITEKDLTEDLAAQRQAQAQGRTKSRRRVTNSNDVVEVDDVVLTVPSYYSMDKRRSLVDAAQLTNLNILGLIHSTTATALQFGVQNHGFGNETVYLVVFDMGATQLEAGVYRFSPVPPYKAGDKHAHGFFSSALKPSSWFGRKDGAGGETESMVAQEEGDNSEYYTPTKHMRISTVLGVMDTLATVHNENLGGRNFDMCIAETLQEELLKRLPVDGPFLSPPNDDAVDSSDAREMQRKKVGYALLRAAKNTREVLSVNTHTPVTVEGIPLRDGGFTSFSTTFTRKQFEKGCDSLFTRIVSTAKEVIEMAAAHDETIRAFHQNKKAKLRHRLNFEMMGGAVRSPRIIHDLSAFLDRRVDRTLNGDEAAALGAAHWAARLSSYMRVKSFTVHDTAREAVWIQASLNTSETRVSETLKAATDSMTAQEVSGSPHLRSILEGRVFGEPRLLFNNSNFGSIKSITLPRRDDFVLKFYVEPHYSRENGTPRRRLIGVLNVSGITDEMKSSGLFVSPIEEGSSRILRRVAGRGTIETGHANNSAQVRLSVRLNYAGLLEVENVELLARYAIRRSVQGEDGKSIVGNITTVRSTLSLPFKFNWVSPQPLSQLPLAFERSARKLAVIENNERRIRAVAVARNALESFIQWTKYDGVLEHAEKLIAGGLINATEVEALKKRVEEIADWNEEGEGSLDSCPRVAFEERLRELKSLVLPPWEKYLDAQKIVKKPSTVAPAIEKNNKIENTTSTEETKDEL